MARMKCNSCGGTYDDVSADGVPYYHACAPLTHTILRLANGTEAEMTGPLPDGAVVLRVESEERPNKRDENIRLEERVDATGKTVHVAVPKSEGLGRTAVGG
jgi:hypothetical protein